MIPLVPQAHVKDIPIIYALTRRDLAYVLKRLRDSKGVSAVGLLSVKGQEKEWDEVCKMSERLKEKWTLMQMGMA